MHQDGTELVDCTIQYGWAGLGLGWTGRSLLYGTASQSDITTATPPLLPMIQRAAHDRDHVPCPESHVVAGQKGR